MVQQELNPQVVVKKTPEIKDRCEAGIFIEHKLVAEIVYHAGDYYTIVDPVSCQNLFFPKSFSSRKQAISFARANF